MYMVSQKAKQVKQTKNEIFKPIRKYIYWKYSWFAILC